MCADKALIDGALTEKVIGAFYEVYNELGAGFLENVYENALALALEESGLHVTRQVPLAVHFRGTVVGEYRADLVVEDRLVIEIKAVGQLSPAHEAQLLNYLKASRREVGLVLNFGSRPQFRRMVASQFLIRGNPRPSAARDHV